MHTLTQDVGRSAVLRAGRERPWSLLPVKAERPVINFPINATLSLLRSPRAFPLTCPSAASPSRRPWRVCVLRTSFRGDETLNGKGGGEGVAERSCSFLLLFRLVTVHTIAYFAVASFVFRFAARGPSPSLRADHCSRPRLMCAWLTLCWMTSHLCFINVPVRLLRCGFISFLFLYHSLSDRFSRSFRHEAPANEPRGNKLVVKIVAIGHSVGLSAPALLWMGSCGNAYKSFHSCLL